MAIPYVSLYDKTIPFSDECAQIGLVANGAVSYTVPGANTLKYTALLSYNSNSNVFVALNTTATVPPGGTATTTKREEFRPFKRFVIGGDVLSFITPDATAYVGVSLRAIPNPSN